MVLQIKIIQILKRYYIFLKKLTVVQLAMSICIFRIHQKENGLETELKKMKMHFSSQKMGKMQF